MEVTWSCNKSKLIFRLWNITKGVCLSSINLVLPGIQRTTSGTGTDFIQSFKLIYNFANAWFKKKRVSAVACEDIHFSLLFATGDVSCRGTSVTQGQKFHTDDANQCLQNKSGSQVASHADVLRAPDINLSNFTCLLVDFGKVLCSSANELQQNSNASSRGDYIPQILTVLLEILLIYF